MQMQIDVFVGEKMGTHNAHMHKKQYQADYYMHTRTHQLHARRQAHMAH